MYLIPLKAFVLSVWLVIFLIKIFVFRERRPQNVLRKFYGLLSQHFCYTEDVISLEDVFLYQYSCCNEDVLSLKDVF